MQLPSDEPAARTRLADAVEYGAVTVIGTVDETMGSVNEPAAVMKTERTWRGHMPNRFEVTSSNCNGITVPFKVGGRLVLEVTRRDGEYWAHGCGAGVVDGASTSTFQDGDAWASALGGLGSTPPFGEDGDSGIPVAAFLLFVTPLAAVALLGVYFTRHRGQ
jgi:hypothetical protein